MSPPNKMAKKNKIVQSLATPNTSPARILKGNDSSVTDNNVTDPTPPIIIENINLDTMDLIKAIKEAVKNKDFKIKFQGKTSAIHLKSRVDHSAVIEILASREIKFYTYGFKQDKPKKFILKGLPSCFSEQDILTELRQNDIPVIAVRQFIKKVKDPPASIKLPIFSVTADPTTSLANYSMLQMSSIWTCQHAL
uniref:ORF1_4 protein n=1 Tax=Fopius arisanus TaxID=64838 RepID=A0A0C9RCW9_9HYME